MTDSPKSTFTEIDLTGVTRYSINELSRKVDFDEFAKVTKPGGTFACFAQSLPQILRARDLTGFADLFCDAAGEKHIIIMFGGHLVKTGLTPLINDWLRRGFLTALATHGASVIHDTEIALFGRTSEDVAEGLADGKFGMVSETADFINGAVADKRNRNLGFGEALGRALIAAKAPHAELSLLCCAYECGVPLTVHIALGTDIIHQHPSADGEAIGRASMRDFRILAERVGGLREGGIVMNVGSAVIMPEVFLKALTVARNVGRPAHGFTAANFDMFTQYRPTQNVLVRPTLTGGRQFNFIGHHEIMLPLLHAMVNEKLGRGGVSDE